MKAVVFARGLSRRPTGRGVLAAEMLRRLPSNGIDGLEVFSGEPLDLPGFRFRAARGSNPISDAWRVFRGIAREIRGIKPDILWSATHLLPPGLPEDLPKVVTLLDVVWRDHPETMSRGRRIAATWMEQGLARADRIFCISEFTRSRLATHWPELADRARVIHLAPNARLPEAHAVEPGGRRPFVVNVDTIEPRKNLGVVFEAMRALPELDLVQAGGVGWNVDGLLESARGLSNVRLAGYVDDPTLASYYRSAVCAVFPSVYEGFHMPPLDAASLGCPVVLSDIPVHREIMGEAAIYVPPKDVDGFARAVKEAAGRRDELAAKGRAQAARYSWDNAAAALADLLREAAGR